MARPGVYTIASAFPKVRIVTASVDPNTNEDYHIIPGIGKSSIQLLFDQKVKLTKLKISKSFFDDDKTITYTNGKNKKNAHVTF